MNLATTLLRIAARTAAASAALVVRSGGTEPVAAWGCDEAAARALLRARQAGPADGPSPFRALPLTLAGGSPAELLLIGSNAPPAEVAALAGLAVEIGAACDGAPAIAAPNAVDRLIESVEQLGDAVAVLETDPDGETRFVHVNAAFSRLFGHPAEELAGRLESRLWGPRTDLDRTAWIRSRMTRRKAVRAVVVLYTRERALLWTEVGSSPVAHEAGDALYHVVTYRDVTARKQFEDALSSEKRKLQTTLASIADAVVTVLGDGRVEFVNAAAQRLLGIALIDAYGTQVAEVIRLVDDEGAPLDVLAGTAAGGAARRGEGHLHGASGVTDVAYVASRIDDEDQGFVVVLRDVTAENRLSLRLSFEANHDPLTSLPNRRAFLERLAHAVQSARDENRHHVVAFLDLDRFKVVNDRFGHAAGDRLLREISAVMGGVVRVGDVIGRIGGDEFALLLSDCTIENARAVVDKLRQAVDAYRIEHTGEALAVGVSIGLAAIEAETASAAQVLAEADTACYQAKAAGRNVVAG